MEQNKSVFGRNPCPHCSVTVYLLSSSKGIANDVNGNWLVYYSTCPNCQRLVIELHRARHHDVTGIADQLVTLAYPKSIQRNLFDAIQHVVDQGNLPSHIAESLHTLRELGNFAAHPNKSTNTAEVIEVEHGEAEWCLDVIDALYDHYFVSPAKTQRAKDAMNYKRNEAGLQPI